MVTTQESIDVYHNPSRAKAITQKSYAVTTRYDATGKVIQISEGQETYNYKYDSNGNISELIINGDSNASHWTYGREPGAGNAPLCLYIFDKPNREPLLTPEVY